MHDILLATGNAKKAREMREIVDSLIPPGQVRWRSLSEFPDYPPPVEDADTFMANAELKAHYYARQSGLWTIADDSGLQVDALGGAPGVLSARYAGEPCSDRANNALLISNLRGVPPERRTAQFRCCVALSDGVQILASAEGRIEGRIVDDPHGENGFGYDPHFWVDDAGMTTAQMPAERKHAISHRGRALRKLAEAIAMLLRS